MIDPDRLTEADLDQAEMEAISVTEDDEIQWLMRNSDGVAGLRTDGSVMPWAEVARLYLPSYYPAPSLEAAE